jgi:hypothetical protein
MQINMKKLRIKRLTGFAAFCVAFSAMSFSADPAGPTSRRIDLDVAQAVRPLDRFSTGRQAPTFRAHSICRRKPVSPDRVLPGWRLESVRGSES